MPELEDRYTDLEKRVSDIDSRQKVLESQYHKDLENIYNILKKLEHKIVGGGLDDTTNIGVVAEMRDLNREVKENNVQTVLIKKSVDEIQKQLLPSQQLLIDVETLKSKIENIEKYKYMIIGGAALLGWVINKITPFFEKMIK